MDEPLHALQGKIISRDRFHADVTQLSIKPHKPFGRALRHISNLAEGPVDTDRFQLQLALLQAAHKAFQLRRTYHLQRKILAQHDERKPRCRQVQLNMGVMGRGHARFASRRKL